MFDSLPIYGFMVWNVFLAWLPLLFQNLYPRIKKVHDSRLRFTLLAGNSLLWLLFLPNAFYLLTDFMHLNPDVLVNQRDDGFNYTPLYSRGDPMFIVNSLLFFIITLAGMIFGGVALKWFVAHTKKLFSYSEYVVTGLLMVIVACGVYIGRFMRFNSWDAVIKPWQVLDDFLRTVTDDLERFIAILLTLVLFEILSLLFVQYFLNPKYFRK